MADSVARASGAASVFKAHDELGHEIAERCHPKLSTVDAGNVADSRLSSLDTVPVTATLGPHDPPFAADAASWRSKVASALACLDAGRPTRLARFSPPCSA